MVTGTISSEGKSFDFDKWLTKFGYKLVDNLGAKAENTATTSLNFPGPQPPSHPFEAPNSQTGNLHNHIKRETHTDSSGSKTVVESTRPSSTETDRVPGYLEFGTAHMEPRPYMSPAYEQARHNFEQIVDITKGQMK